MTSARSVPWQPASTCPEVGSSRIARSAASQSGRAAGHPAEAVAGRLDLLVVVEDQGEVVASGSASVAASRSSTATPDFMSERAAAVAAGHRPDATARCRRSARCRGGRPAAPGAAGPARCGPARCRRPGPPPGRAPPAAPPRPRRPAGPRSPDTEATSTSAAVSSAPGRAQVEAPGGGHGSAGNAQNSFPSGSATTHQSMSSSGAAQHPRPQPDQRLDLGAGQPHVQVNPVLHGLRLRHLVEEHRRPRHAVRRVDRDRRVAVRRAADGGQERQVILLVRADMVAEHGGPEPGQTGRVAGVDDDVLQPGGGGHP